MESQLIAEIKVDGLPVPIKCYLIPVSRISHLQSHRSLHTLVYIYEASDKSLLFDKIRHTSHCSELRKDLDTLFLQPPPSQRSRVGDVLIILAAGKNIYTAPAFWVLEEADTRAGNSNHGRALVWKRHGPWQPEPGGGVRPLIHPRFKILTLQYEHWDKSVSWVADPIPFKRLIMFFWADLILTYFLS